MYFLLEPLVIFPASYVIFTMQVICQTLGKRKVIFKHGVEKGWFVSFRGGYPKIGRVAHIRSSIEGTFMRIYHKNQPLMQGNIQSSYGSSGEMIQFDEHSFQMGCFNHQLFNTTIYNHPSHPCTVYLHIFTYICLIYMVGKYTMHGSFEGYIWWNYREKIIILGNSMLVKRYSLARYVFLGWMEKILHSWSGQSVLPSISHGPFFKNIPWWCKKKPGTINSKKKPVSASLDPYQIQWKKWG